LYLPRCIELTAYQTEGRIGVAAAGGVRLAKLNPVEEIEDFSAKLQI
jgi:hypothetical protein